MWGIFEESTEGPPGTYEARRQHVIPTSYIGYLMQPGHVAHLGCPCGFRLDDRSPKLVVHADPQHWEHLT